MIILRYNNNDDKNDIIEAIIQNDIRRFVNTYCDLIDDILVYVIV